jgi:hypothetical protein
VSGMPLYIDYRVARAQTILAASPPVTRCTVDNYSQ